MDNFFYMRVNVRNETEENSNNVAFIHFSKAFSLLFSILVAVHMHVSSGRSYNSSVKVLCHERD